MEKFQVMTPFKSKYFTAYTTIDLTDIECIWSIQKTTIASPTKFLVKLMLGYNNFYHFSDFDVLSVI